MSGDREQMMITGQKPIRKSKQGSFQIVDIVEIMRPLTKVWDKLHVPKGHRLFKPWRMPFKLFYQDLWFGYCPSKPAVDVSVNVGYGYGSLHWQYRWMQFAKQIVDGDLVPSLVREAVRVAEEERPGAVHLELPEDIAETTTDAHPFPVYPVRRPIAEGKAINKAIEMINNASHPLLLIGAGANRKRTQKMWVASMPFLSYFIWNFVFSWNVVIDYYFRSAFTCELKYSNQLCGGCCRLREFVDEVHMPFVNTQMGKGVVTGTSWPFSLKMQYRLWNS
jgi:glyoxylate carboligase